MCQAHFLTKQLIAIFVGFTAALYCERLFAQSNQTFSQKIQSIIDRPLYKHATFGLELYSLDSGEPVFTLNSNQMFTPGSTTKLLTEGTALELLGDDFRFHTHIYRTGRIDSHHKLKGDLVLVAAADPNLSNRIQSDGTLAFENEDHSYGGMPQTKAVPGDPLQVIRELAGQIAAKGIKKVQGRVLVDATLFPEGDRELGTGVVISPISVNDNVLDITIQPGTTAGAPAEIKVSPQTSYVKMITSKAGLQFHADDPVEVANSDGTYTVTLAGSTPAGGRATLISYAVPRPSRFAQIALIECLREKGIAVSSPESDAADFNKLKPFYTVENLVAEHVSPPFSQEVKVTLKVSQNLHASMTPFLLGILVGKATAQIEQAGFDQERILLQKAGLDLTGASQGDGAGGAPSAYFTPDFMVHYLAYMARQTDFAVFENALPILGRDGTLAEIQPGSPAAGHVFAKTGTFGSVDNLNKRLLLNGKGLAGYMTTATGSHLAFAFYINHVGLPLDDPNASQETAGQALGEIAAAAYLLPIDRPALSK